MSIITTLSGRKALPLMALLSIAATTAGCSSSIALDAEQKENLRVSINTTTKATINQFIEQNPELESEINEAYGYMVADIHSTKIPLLGKATGIGAIYDNEAESVTYINLRREDIGIGLGHSEYKIVSIFEDESSLEVFRKGINSATVSTQWNFTDGDLSSYNVNANGESVSTYTLNRKGGQASLTASFVDIEKNLTLTDTGLSNTSVSMKESSTNSVTPVKHWDRALPFFGQRVIELGHDLPLPIGLSFIYASTKQNMELYDLSVINKEGEYVPIEFVEFENNNNESITPQIKLDAWLFPFMNVFASVGRIEGEANVNFGLDGNKLLNQLGIDCSNARGTDRSRCNRYQGVESEIFDVNVNMSGMSYTLGAVLAAGWDSYFISVPVSFTKVKMDDRSIDGNVVTVSPRIGKVFSYSAGNSLAVYVGVSYMDNEVRITGSQPIPGTDDRIDYQISQRSDDIWEPLIGANLNFNQRWSAFFEWTGTYDGRQQFTGGISRRF